MSNKRELFDALEVVLDLGKTALNWRNKRKKKQKAKEKKSSSSKNKSILTSVIGTAVTYFAKTIATQLARNLTKKK